MEKLGIVIPYRNRKEHLDVFIPYMREFFKTKGLFNYEFFVVEQDDSNFFNRGLLLNCGFLEAEKHKCSRVCFHDVDLLPVDANLYSLYPEEPVELVRNIEGEVGTLPYNYFGGVTLVSIKDFRKVNGYSNRYEGWGFEDDDFLLRCHKAHIGRTVKQYSLPNTTGSAVVFKEDRVETLDMDSTRGMTVFVADFLPEYQKASVGLQDMVVVSLKDPVTGLETSISYDKFNCYRATVWDKNWGCFSIVTGKAPLIHSRCVLAVDRARKSYSFYWNGKCYGKYELRSSEIRLLTNRSGKIQIGKNFRGSILEAGIFIVQDDLSDEELSNISLSKVDPKLKYDARTSEFFTFKEGSSVETIWIASSASGTIKVPVPLQAATGVYKTLKHKGNNTVVEGHYLPEICKNQERFYTIARGEMPNIPDGISTLDEEWSRNSFKVEDDVVWIKVKRKDEIRSLCTLPKS